MKCLSTKTCYICTWTACIPSAGVCIPPSATGLGFHCASPDRWQFFLYNRIKLLSLHINVINSSARTSTAKFVLVLRAQRFCQKPPIRCKAVARATSYEKRFGGFFYSLSEPALPFLSLFSYFLRAISVASSRSMS